MLFGSHWFDLLPLVLLALLVFGPKRLREMGAAIGKTIKGVQQSMSEVTDTSIPPASSGAIVTTPELTTPIAVTAIAAPTSMQPGNREAASTEVRATGMTTKPEHAAIEAPQASWLAAAEQHPRPQPRRVG